MYYIYLLFQFPVATGIDGYYYVVQIDSFYKSGHFYFPSNTPLILLLLSFLKSLITDTVLAIKLGIIILQIFLFFGIFAVLKTITKNIWLTALGVFLVGYSALGLYFLSEFISSLGAVTFLIWAVFGAVKTVETRKNGWAFFLIVMSLATIFSHRSGIWLIVGFCFTSLFSKLLIDSKFEIKIVISLFYLLIFFLPFLLVYQNLFTLPAALYEELNAFPQLPFHISTLMEKLILFAVCGVSLISFFKLKDFSSNASNVVLLTTVFWSILILFNPFLFREIDILGITARLDMLAYLLAAISTPLLIRLLWLQSKKITIIFLLFLALLLPLRFFSPLPLGLQQNYLQDRVELIKELSSMQPNICQNPIVIGKHGEQFLLTSVLNIPSQQKPPIENQFECVIWLVHQPKEDYQIMFDNGLTSPNGNFTLVEDAELKRIISTMPTDERNDLLFVNPHIRPLTR